ncbi:kinase-like domain-containing protein [Massariosphaeria phaeospora]|uniref:Kinase-like domain-containing protein n=1 Tax=Massariosphaeria phaeospora TaxID=100035 RepID=A0A7C8I0R0_9PLEO|nr:kinase-like domain-containing protein [Massariosphaeria phaeospora]
MFPTGSPWRRDPFWHLHSSERHYILTENIFTKRELQRNEFPTNIKTGLVVTPRWSRERLQNEAAALQYITSETSIPVPQFIDLFDHNGVLHLQTKRVRGTPLDEIDKASAPTAVKCVNAYMESTVLPQLRKLRHNTLGSVNRHLPLLLPSKITYRDKRSSWVRHKSHTQDFVFCHNDLGQHNIFVDPKTFVVTAIIDWEFAGFFPPEFENKMWWHAWDQTTKDDERTDQWIRWLSTFDGRIGFDGGDRRLHAD